MFEQGHVKYRSADKLPKHSKHLKNALHHANPVQMPQSKQRTSFVLKVGSAKNYQKFCRSLLCVNCKAVQLFEITRRNCQFCFCILVCISHCVRKFRLYHFENAK